MNNSGKRVLIIDDNPDITKSMRILLGLLGHDVQTASNGPDGLETAAAYQPDVVLLDIGLPVMDGYAVARALREQAGGSDMAIIAVSGWGDERTLAESNRAGFDEHWIKPIGAAEIAAFMTHAPSRERSRD